MSTQVHTVPGQAEGRREASLERTSIDLSSKLSITCGLNVNYYKAAYHPISILPVGIEKWKRRSFREGERSGATL